MQRFVVRNGKPSCVPCRGKKAGGTRSPAPFPSAAAQPGAQGDAGLRFGLFSPSFVRPRPLARALGNRNSQAGSAGYKCYKCDCHYYFMSDFIVFLLEEESGIFIMFHSND